MLFKLDDFEKLVALLYQNNDLKIIFAAIGLRRLLSFEKNPPI